MKHPFVYLDYLKYLGSLFDDWDNCKFHVYKPNGLYKTCVNCGHTISKKD